MAHRTGPAHGRPHVGQPGRGRRPAIRPITVFDLLTSDAGYGFASDFSLPAIQLLSAVQKDGREARELPAAAGLDGGTGPDSALQPGEAWLYDTCSTLQGVLVARASGQPLPAFLAERVFAPLGMTDTGFDVQATKRNRCHQLLPGHDGDGGLELADGPDGHGAHRLISRWGTGAWPGRRMTGSRSPGCCWPGAPRPTVSRLLTADSVAADDHRSHHPAPARDRRSCSWRARAGVSAARWTSRAIDPWNVPGRYGWVGGTGTSAHITPSTGTVAILLTQVAADSPVPPQWMRDFWHYATTAG